MRTRRVAWGLALWIGSIAGCQFSQTQDTDAGASSLGSTLGNLDPTRPVTAESKMAFNYDMAHAFETQNDFAKAERAYRAILDGNSREGRAHHRLAVLLVKQGRTEEAFHHFDLAVQHAPQAANVHVDYGYALYLQERWQEAETALQYGLRLDPRNARGHNIMGMLLAKTGRAPQSLQSFAYAGCTSSQAHTNLAFAAMSVGDRQTAQRHYQLALQSDPSSQVARNGLDTLQKVAALQQSVAPNGAYPEAQIANGATGRDFQLR